MIIGVNKMNKQNDMLFKMLLCILFSFVFLVADNANAKRARFRNFILPPGFKESKYQFEDWEEIKGKLTTNILRGNELDVIINNIVCASYTLAALGKMNINDNERTVVREYLINFLFEYLTDRRFMQLLKDKENPKGKNSVFTTEPADFDIVYMPSYILCTIAVNNPTKEDIEKIGNMLFKYKTGKTMPEQYLIDFLSDLFYFKNLKNAKDYLEKQDFSCLSPRGQEKIKALHISMLAEMQDNQKDTWAFLLQVHLKLLHEKDTKHEVDKYLILTQESLFEQIFTTLYPEADYQLLLILSQGNNPDEELFFMYQLMSLMRLGYANKKIKANDIKTYCNAIKTFLDKHKTFKSSKSATIYESIANEYNRMQKELEPLH